MKSTKYNRGSLEKDRKADHTAGNYPFAGGINVEEPTQVMAYLAKFNAGMADVQSGLLASGLRPGMAGYDGPEGYSVATPGADPARIVY
jgi:hypothetical protein